MNPSGHGSLSSIASSFLICMDLNIYVDVFDGLGVILVTMWFHFGIYSQAVTSVSIWLQLAAKLRASANMTLPVKWDVKP